MLVSNFKENKTYLLKKSNENQFAEEHRILIQKSIIDTEYNGKALILKLISYKNYTIYECHKKFNFAKSLDELLYFNSYCNRELPKSYMDGIEFDVYPHERSIGIGSLIMYEIFAHRCQFYPNIAFGNLTVNNHTHDKVNELRRNKLYEKFGFEADDNKFIFKNKDLKFEDTLFGFSIIPLANNEVNESLLN